MRSRSRSIPTSASVTPALASLLERRAFACRLTPDRALQSLDEAEAFLAERGMLTLTPDCALPSLFGACHEEPYRPGGHGFASWPRTKYIWHFELSARPDVHILRIHRGKSLYLSAQTLALVDSLCRAELAHTKAGEYSPAAARLIEYLDAAGPSLVEDIKRELGLDTATLRRLRQRLESVGALVSCAVAVPAVKGTERETSELARWDQRFAMPQTAAATTPEAALDDLVVAGVRAAVVAPRVEIGTWFSWPLAPTRLDSLMAQGRLSQPLDGWIAASE
ncbi:MAG TPA: hypothetical protein VFY92_02055 [Hyphomicrobiaceae bacterium]|nr:hypothetical protein [Hyphomicrobiaceae bacterium]